MGRFTDAQIDRLHEETNLEKGFLEDIIEELENKKQIILQGPPGTGKTFVAKKIRDCLDIKRWNMVQFHTSYSYEEFMEGYKPSVDEKDNSLKFSVKDGILKKFVDELDVSPEKWDYDLRSPMMKFESGSGFFQWLKPMQVKTDFWLANSNHTGKWGNSWGKCIKYGVFHLSFTGEKGSTNTQT